MNTSNKIKPGDLVTINPGTSADKNTDVYIFWPYPYDHATPEFHPRIYYYSLNDPPMLYLGPATQLKTQPNSEHLEPHRFLHQGKIVFTQIRKSELLEKVFQKAR